MCWTSGRREFLSTSPLWKKSLHPLRNHLARQRVTRDQVLPTTAQRRCGAEEDEYAPDDGDDVEDMDMDVGTDEDIDVPSSAPADVRLAGGPPGAFRRRQASASSAAISEAGSSSREDTRNYKSACDAAIEPSPRVRFEADGGRASAKKWKISLRSCVRMVHRGRRWGTGSTSTGTIPRDSHRRQRG